MRYIKRISASEVRRRVDDAALMQALRQAFVGLHSGRNQQPRETKFPLPDERGDCIFYPALDFDGGVIGMNVSPLIFSLAERGQSPVTAYTLLLSAHTGVPIALVEAMALTALRTAAVSHLAASLLCDCAGKVLTIVGAGPLGIEHARMARDSNTWGRVIVASPSLSDRKSPNYPKRIGELKRLGKGIDIAEDVRGAVGNASVLMLCTSSGVPVVQPSWLGSNLECITSISTNSPSAHEIPLECLNDFDVYCDYRPTAPTTAGDMVLAGERQVWGPNAIKADLPELTAGAADLDPRDSRRIKYFRSTGLGIEDAVVARLYCASLGLR